MNSPEITQRFAKFNFVRALVGAMLAFGLIAVACQMQAPPISVAPMDAGSAIETTTIPEYTIMAHEYAFNVPQEIEAGLVRIKFEDHGEEPHHLQFARLNEGVTYEQFVETLQTSEPEAMALITFPGGAGTIDPGGNTAVLIDLEAGNYVVICFVFSPDGTPHFVKGMTAPVIVVETVLQEVEPDYQATVTLYNFSFQLPSDIKAGKQVWRVLNEGDQLHEINLIKLADDKHIADVQEWLKTHEGPPPFSNVGGFNALDVGKVGYMELDLTPGTYMAICHVPDVATGQPHELLGMVMPFKVS